MMRAVLYHRDTPALLLAAGVLAGAFSIGLVAPPLFSLCVWAATAAGVLVLAVLHPVAACVLWLLITGMSLEMTLHDMVGDQAFQPTIAAIKGAGLLLAGLCAARFGLRADPFNPSWVFLFITAAGLVHGLHPGLTPTDSLRSAIGSITPFVFAFCRLPRDWPAAMICATKWAPLAAVVAAVPFDLAGIRPLFVDSGGLRLAGLGHPAFLANVCLPAVYACLIQTFRSGRRGDLCLLILNGFILLLTGARAPLAYVAGVCGIALLTVRSTAFPARDRVPLLLFLGALLPVTLLLAGNLEDLRVFNLFLHEVTNLSGRNLLWPEFEAAANASPWFGWGTGAGNVIVPSTGLIAQALHTWAAHNEYLRIGVEGGQVGRALLIAQFAAWVLTHTHRLPQSERRVMRLAFLALAAHAVTDNVLISTPACVLFAFAAAVFARGRAEAAEPG